MNNISEEIYEIFFNDDFNPFMIEEFNQEMFEAINNLLGCELSRK